MQWQGVPESVSEKDLIYTLLSSSYRYWPPIPVSPTLDFHKYCMYFVIGKLDSPMLDTKGQLHFGVSLCSGIRSSTESTHPMERQGVDIFKSQSWVEPKS